jgi:hypothetical protein
VRAYETLVSGSTTTTGLLIQLRTLFVILPPSAFSSPKYIYSIIPV